MLIQSYYVIWPHQSTLFSIYPNVRQHWIGGQWRYNCRTAAEFDLVLTFIDLPRGCKQLPLTHCGRGTHICVTNINIIGLDNGLSPRRCRAIIETNAGILLIGPLVTKVSEILFEIHTFSFKKVCLKMSSGKWRPFGLDINVLRPLEFISLMVFPTNPNSPKISFCSYPDSNEMIATKFLH